MLRGCLLLLLLALDAPTPSPEVETDLAGTTWVAEYKVENGAKDDLLQKRVGLTFARDRSGALEASGGFGGVWTVGPPGRVRTFDTGPDGFRGIYKVEGG